jgi:hypothetical protein
MREQTENLILQQLRATRADIGAIVVDTHACYDRLAEHIERIERRLELRDTE